MFDLFNILLESSIENRITFHVSPIKFDPSDKYGQGYDELYDMVNAYNDDEEGHSTEEYNLLRRTLKAYEKGMGNVSAKKNSQIYVSSQPQAWIDVQEDELNITYKFGGIYGILTRYPVEEHDVPSGMGQILPEAIINISDIIKYVGPFKTKLEAFNALKASN